VYGFAPARCSHYGERPSFHATNYDAIGRTTLVDNRDGEGAVISSFAYERDAVGNPISIEREDGYTVYYEYDARHQLTRETHVDGGQTVYAWEWDYDAAGNREFQVFNGQATYYAYNAANELLTETTGGQTTYYSYDACGNTTAKQEAAGTTYYQWDHENLMTRIDLPEGGHSYFAYDADSKRVSKRDAEGFTEFVYQGPDMLRLLLERDEAGDTQAHYTMGAGLEAMRRADGGDIFAGDSSFYHFDWLGSTFALTDDEQDVTDIYLYNAWGEVLDRTGTTQNPHQWVGRERYYGLMDAEMALLGLRYYVPLVGSFWSLDRLLTSSNRYAYVTNMPAAARDPYGLYVDSRGDIGGLAEFVSGERKFMYTCNCGWLDRSHLYPGQRAAERMWNVHMRDNPRFEMAMYSFTAERVLTEVVGITLYAKVGFYTRPRIEWLPKTDTRTWLRIAAYVAYGVLWQVEYLQAGAFHPSGWSYEDLPSDYLGALLGTGEYGERQLLGACAPLSRPDALCVYDRMERACAAGDPTCHRKGGRVVKVAFPRNPIPHARLFHRLYSETRSLCSSDSPPQLPANLHVAWGIRPYIDLAGFDTTFADEYEI